jgi:hypothetical protein
MVPLKQIPKTDKDKELEKHLKEAKKNVVNNALQNNLTIANIINDPPKTGPSKHKLNVEVPNFEKKANGLKQLSKPKPTINNQINNQPISNPIPTNPNITMPPITKHLTKTDKMTVQQKQVFTSIPTFNKPVPLFQQNTPIIKPPTYRSPTQTLFDTNKKAKSITYSNLTVISKCKKCKQ